MEFAHISAKRTEARTKKKKKKKPHG
jgi:hypothetical protein